MGIVLTHPIFNCSKDEAHKSGNALRSMKPSDNKAIKEGPQAMEVVTELKLIFRRVTLEMYRKFLHYYRLMFDEVNEFCRNE